MDLGTTPLIKTTKLPNALPADAATSPIFVLLPASPGVAPSTTVSFGDPRFSTSIWERSRVDPVTGCWLFEGTHNQAGYGILRWRGHSNVRLHLASGNRSCVTCGNARVIAYNSRQREKDPEGVRLRQHTQKQASWARTKADPVKLANRTAQLEKWHAAHPDKQTEYNRRSAERKHRRRVETNQDFPMSIVRDTLDSSADTVRDTIDRTNIPR